MINLTKKQIDFVLTKIEESLNKYDYLQRNFRRIDVSTAPDYQKKFNSYYRVRRNFEWRSHYFKLLEENKSKGILFSDALRTMYRNTGRYEASFVSKLVATIDTNLPVIDKFVLSNAGLKLPYCYVKDRDNKIINNEKVYFIKPPPKGI